MPDISFESIKKLTESGEKFVNWIVDIIRNSNWVTLLVLATVLVGVVANPVVVKEFLKLDELYSNYVTGYVIVIIFLLTTAITVAYCSKSNDSQVSNGIRLAVLPFKNLSPESNYEAYSDGFTESIISCLQNVDGLNVISETSILPLKDKDLTLSQINEKLHGFDYALEGSLFRIEDNCRINARLVRAKDDTIIHTVEKEFPWAQLITLKKQLTNKVLNNLAIVSDQYALFEAQTENMDAFEAHMLAMYNLRQYNNIRKKEFQISSEKHFKRALQYDPAYIGAMVNLGFLYLISWETEGSESWLEKSEQVYKDVLKVNPDNAHATAEIGFIAYTNGDFNNAIELARKAVRLNNKGMIANNVLSLIYLYAGFYEANIYGEKIVHVLSPLYTYPYTNECLAWQMIGDYDEAIKSAEKARQIEPKAFTPLLLLGESYYRAGNLQQAKSTWEFGLSIAPDTIKSVFDVVLGWLLADEGDIEAASKIVKKQKPGQWLSGAYDPYLISLCSLSGNHDKAIELLNKGPTYASSYRYLISDQTLKPLYTNAEFQSLLNLRYKIWSELIDRWGKSLKNAPPKLTPPESILS